MKTLNVEHLASGVPDTDISPMFWNLLIYKGKYAFRRCLFDGRLGEAVIV
jgi:hypothetical protein